MEARKSARKAANQKLKEKIDNERLQEIVKLQKLYNCNFKK